MPESALILWGAAFVVAMLTIVIVAVAVMARGDARVHVESTEQRLARLEDGLSRVRGEQDTMIRECLGLLRKLGMERNGG